MIDEINEKQNRVERYREFLWRKISESYDQQDRAILTLSSGGLGLSLAFLRDIAPMESIIIPWVLEMSWILFITAILLTTLSIVTGRCSAETQFEKVRIATQLEGIGKSKWSSPTRWLNRISVLAFSCAVISTGFFAVRNFG